MLRIQIPWNAADGGFRVLVSSTRLGAFMDACSLTAACLIQAKPFSLDSRYTTLIGVPVPAFSSSATWNELDCASLRLPVGPELKFKCTKSPNPKIFVRLVGVAGLFGLGAYVAWLRRTACRAGGAETALRYHVRLVRLMRRVFKAGPIIVHNTDVRYFHLKAPR
jgi:hypothetical protein